MRISNHFASIDLQKSKTPGRPGIVLLVVIAMLALFATLGLSFVYYAQAEAEASRISTQIQNQAGIDADPELLLAEALKQLLFGLGDFDSNLSTNAQNAGQGGIYHNVYSSLRGLDLMSNSFGYNSATLNVTPFNGINLPSNVYDQSTNGTMLSQANSNQPLVNFVNYRFFPEDPIIRDPGRYPATGQSYRTNPNGPYTVSTYLGRNVGFTYPDLNSVFLGQMKADGTIVAQSFWRNWTGIKNNSLDRATANPDWEPWNYTDFVNDWLTQKYLKSPQPWKKYATLRPLPWYNRGDPAIALYPLFLGANGTQPGQTGFPFPEDGGGDVKNVEFGPGVPGGGGSFNNDSIWIDLGYPVRTAANGKKYKPLFAFFINDLDGKVNINAAGNIRLTDNTAASYPHGSNKGFTPTEINIGQVLSAPDPNTGLKEWPYLFQGQFDGQYGRYGKDGAVTNAGASWPAGTPSNSPYYGVHDADGCKLDPKSGKYTTSEKMLLQNDAGYPYQQHVAFPYFSPDTYGNGSAAELLQLPWLYNGWIPGNGSDDRAFPLSNMEALLRYQGSGSPALTSELYRRLYNNLNNTDGADNQKKRWRNITLLSADFARPALSPWLTSNSNPAYQLTLGNTSPSGGPVSLPTIPGNSPGTGEFAGSAGGFVNDLRGASMKLVNAFFPNTPNLTGQRFNLQTPVYDTSTGKWRALTAYPQTDKFGRVTGSVQQAVEDRQQFAQNIFDRLRLVTTGARPTDPLPGQATDDYKALRWLAQLSANIVDLIDDDNIPTVFVWDPNNAGPTSGYVVGTELPKVLINEVYAEVDNAPNDNDAMMGPQKDYRINFWVELINPLLNDPNGKTNAAGQDVGSERLQVTDGGGALKEYPVYTLVLLDTSNTNGSDPTIRDLNNILGTPDYQGANNLVKAEVTCFDPMGKTTPNADNLGQYTVTPLNQASNLSPGPTNAGFYMMGPQDNFPKGPNPMPAPPMATLTVPDGNGKIPSQMYYEVSKNTPLDNTFKPRSAVVLRRLVNPGMPPSNPGASPIQAGKIDPSFNPYVTMDYVEKIVPQDGVQVEKMPNLGMHNNTPIEQRRAKGRRQPYAADQSQQVDQAPNPQLTDQPQHTMLKHNAAVFPIAQGDATLTIPFTWLTHLDRNVVSPIELLNVSAYRQHELTQQFITNAGKHLHLANWTSSDLRIYRLLEYLDAGWRMNNAINGVNVSQDGRVPGKININTIWDKAVFQALCDQNLAVNFTAAEVDSIYDNLFTSNTNNASRSPNGQPAQGDRPFQSLAAPNTGNSDGVAATILRVDPASNIPLAQPASATHPTQKLELLSKIFNNITTRSNVFAVWVTVGFFEVYEWPNINTIAELSKYPNWSNLPGGTHYELGKEIGREENRHVRHRMFAIVDRTTAMIPKNLGVVTPQNITGKGQQTVPITLNTTPGLPTGTQRVPAPYQLDFSFLPQPGMIVDVGGEQVTLIAPTNSTQITAVFNQAHTAPAVISVPAVQAVDAPAYFGAANPLIYGNPGPQLRFDHRQHIGLVPYYSIIQ